VLSWLRGLFAGRPVLVQGAARLPEGDARVVALGDPLAGGKELVLVRRDGKLLALDRLCPHEGGRMAEGPLAEGRYVVCPLHNYKFDPRTGRAVGVACKSARVYRVRELGEDAEVWA
jgi:nitrite reductase/ring-hydroxylating ferredoxin subunit